MEESSLCYRVRSMADVAKEMKRKIKGNSTPRSPFISRRIKRSKIMTPRTHRSLLNKRIEKGEDSFEILALGEECEKEVKKMRKEYSVLVQNEEAVWNQRLKDIKELQYAIQKCMRGLGRRVYEASALMEESSFRYRARSMADVAKEMKRKIKGNSTPRSPFILRRVKRSKITTPRTHRSLLNKRIEKGEDSFELDSVADIDNSATSLRGTSRNHASGNIDNSPQEQFSLDPLEDVLTTMRHQERSISHFHQNRILALGEECEKEIKKMRKKYSVLVQNEEAVWNQWLKDMKELKYAIKKNLIFAELFGSNLTENNTHGNLKEVQGTSYSAQQHTRPPAPSKHLHSSSSRVDDLIQKLPKLNISKIPDSLSPSTSAPAQPVHSSWPTMDPPSSLVVPSPPDDQGQPTFRPITIRTSSMPMPPMVPTASNVYFRAPAPHLHRYRPK